MWIVFVGVLLYGVIGVSPLLTELWMKNIIIHVKNYCPDYTDILYHQKYIWLMPCAERKEE